MKVLSVKVLSSKKGGYLEYKNKINFEDFKALALIFEDLSSHGGNIEKAYQEYKRKKLGEGSFPPW